MKRKLLLQIFIGLILISYMGCNQSEKITKCKLSLKGIETALEFFYNDHDRYPTSAEGLNSCCHLKGQNLKDPWGNNFDYLAIDSSSGALAYRYKLRSRGPDGKSGTKDDINSEVSPFDPSEVYETTISDNNIKNGSSITLANYNKIRNGMNYSQVKKILQSEGTEISSSNIAGTSTIMYQWTGDDGISNMNAMFQNDKLISKAQFGLK